MHDPYLYDDCPVLNNKKRYSVLIESVLIEIVKLGFT